MSYNFVYNLNNKLSVAKSTKSTTKFTTKSTKYNIYKTLILKMINNHFIELVQKIN